MLELVRAEHSSRKYTEPRGPETDATSPSSGKTEVLQEAEPWAGRKPVPIPLGASHWNPVKLDLEGSFEREKSSRNGL